VNLTVKTFVLRGLAAGAAGGVVAALVLQFLTQAQIGIALRFEDAMELGLPPGDPADFSRGTQQLGGMVAALIYGAVLGLVLGVALASLRHRIAGRNDFERAAKIATAAFVAMVLIPAMKYPPNPPAVGDPDSVGSRTGAYLTLLLASLVIVVAVWYLWQYLTERGIDGGARFLLGGGAFAVLVTLALVVWPANDDPLEPPRNEAAPALVVADDAPDEVLDELLATARTGDAEWLRDPADPDEALDLDSVPDGAVLAGTPAAISTAELVPHSYTAMVWHFRILSIGGLALMWAVMAGVLGVLLDRAARPRS
jgi:hypothetical protein